ncbi:hypothetical protein M0802_014327 [Mischocyttarus mexicanus]|nr:hypothetical protein M0802_014327 [Mischocyttarus mexicanus]
MDACFGRKVRPIGLGWAIQRPQWGCECMGILMKRLSAFMRMWANDVKSKPTIRCPSYYPALMCPSY